MGADLPGTHRIPPNPRSTPMTPTTIPEVLNAAADLLEREGAWTQQRAGMPFPSSCDGPTCVGFAIERNAKGQSLEPYFDALYRVIPASSVGELIVWNDDPARSQTEVVSALRNAAAMAVQS